VYTTLYPVMHTLRICLDSTILSRYVLYQPPCL
jgi:hypothetical protein